MQNHSTSLRNNILNVGWIGQGDFGDEAMAYALRTALRKHGFDSIGYYVHGSYQVHRDNHDIRIHKLHPFTRSDKIKYIFDTILLRKYTTLIIGGGSIFHSYTSMKWKFDLLQRMRAMHGKKFFSAALGVSLGPFKNKQEEQLCSDFLGALNMVLVRDNHSYTLARHLSNSSNSISSIDTTLALPIVCREQFSAATTSQRESDTVGVMFIRKKGEEEIFEKQNHKQKFLSIIDSLTEHGKRVILFNLYIGQLYPDITLNTMLHKEAKHPDQIEIHSYSGDIFTTTSQFNRCSSIISMRLHGVIFAYMLGIPFVSLGYNEKNRNFCESVRYPLSLCFDFYTDEMPSIMEAIENVVNNGKQFTSKAMPVKDASTIVYNNLYKLLNELNHVDRH